MRKPGLPLADVAFTLAVGRKAHAFRRVVVAGSAADASPRCAMPTRPGAPAAAQPRAHRRWC
jgi:acyl transferase domain-containing protein